MGHVDTRTMRGLTRREQDILDCLAEGMSDKEIASACGISIGTVRTHTKNLFRKLDVHNRDEAGETAQRLGLL